MSTLRSVILRFPLRREAKFEMDMPVLRRVLGVRVLEGIPYVWVLCQIINGPLRTEKVHALFLCEGQNLECDVTELDYWGALVFEDSPKTVCHYFSMRKDEYLQYGHRQRDQRGSPPDSSRVA
jgi:hypothetical protein